MCELLWLDETQRAVSYYVIPPGPIETRASEVLPIGKEMSDVQLLVLTTEQKLAGIGEVGELYMRSPHLARGYLYDKTLTEERFLANPFTHDRTIDCTVRGIVAYTCLMATWRFWGESIRRSSCAAFVSSWEKSRQR